MTFGYGRCRGGRRADSINTLIVIGLYRIYDGTGSVMRFIERVWWSIG